MNIFCYNKYNLLNIAYQDNVTYAVILIKDRVLSEN